MSKSFFILQLLLMSIVFSCHQEIKAQEEGLASYYHNRFHGQKSSSGRVHNKQELVAAHRTYPFGTFLRVTNLSNMKTVIVCVTDRGPRRKNRIIDVSEEAAKTLDFIAKGITRVRIEAVPGPLDLRYLDLIYPQIPYITIESAVEPPFRLNFKN